LYQVTLIITGGVRGKAEEWKKKKRNGGRGENVQENPANDSYAYGTKRGDERTSRNAAQRSLGRE